MTDRRRIVGFPFMTIVILGIDQRPQLVPVGDGLVGGARCKPFFFATELQLREVPTAGGADEVGIGTRRFGADVFKHLDDHLRAGHAVEDSGLPLNLVLAVPLPRVQGDVAAALQVLLQYGGSR